MESEDVDAKLQLLITDQSTMWDFCCNCIWIEQDRIGCIGAAVLAKQLAMSCIVERLSLRGNKIGDDGTALLASALEENSSLQEMDLSGNDIGAAGATALAKALKTNSTVQHINISGNKVGDRGVRALAEALEVNFIVQHLDLSVNQVQDKECLRVVDVLLQRNRDLQAKKSAELKHTSQIHQRTVKEEANSSCIGIQGICCSASSTNTLALEADPERRSRLVKNAPSQCGTLPTSPAALAVGTSDGRTKNRWGDGIDAPAAGLRHFWPNGWTPERDALEAIQVFGHTPDKLQRIAERGRQHAAKPGIVMKPEHAAAVYAYTQDDPVVDLYSKCNEACRTSGNWAEERLTLYRDYLYHLEQAVSVLPPFMGKVYRGIPVVMESHSYKVGRKITWQSFTSTTRSPYVASRFLCQTDNELRGSLFVLHVNTGKDISGFSEFSTEQEVLMAPNSQWRVVSFCADSTEKKKELHMFANVFDMTELHVYILQQI
eukprot:EG_transcript_9807